MGFFTAFAKKLFSSFATFSRFVNAESFSSSVRFFQKNGFFWTRRVLRFPRNICYLKCISHLGLRNNLFQIFSELKHAYFFVYKIIFDFLHFCFVKNNFLTIFLSNCLRNLIINKMLMVRSYITVFRSMLIKKFCATSWKSI